MPKTLTTKPLLAPIRARAKEPRSGQRRMNELHLDAANVVHAASLAGTAAAPLFDDMHSFSGAFSLAPRSAPARQVEAEDTGAHVVAEWGFWRGLLTDHERNLRWAERCVHRDTDSLERLFAEVLRAEREVARLEPLLP
jgi:hypothetical protein